MSEQAVTPAGRELFGHPRGLAVLSFTELWERFSYYGMMGLLTLYMTDQLLKPGHVEHVLGFGPFRAAVEAVFGRLTTVALASQIFGLYTGFVYVTPLLGGLVGDRWLGQRRTVVLGVVMMAAGHLAMTSEALFLVALLLLILGAGCIKGNMAAQVGRLYAPEDTRRTRAFAIYLAALNVGALVAPLVCGTLGERLGWHWGFGAAGLGMLIALAAYLHGQRDLPPDTVKAAGTLHAKPPPLAARDVKVIAGLLLLLVPNLLSIGSYNQAWNMFLVWADANVDRHVLGFETPVTWYATLDGILTIVALGFCARLWAWQARRGREPADLAKVVIGCALTSAAFLVLAGGALAAGGRPTPLWPTLAFFLLADLAIPFIDPVVMSLISRDAPAAVNTTMIAVYYLSIGFGNIGAGWLGRFYEPLSHGAFWLLHAAIVAAAVIFLLLFGRWLARLLAHAPQAR